MTILRTTNKHRHYFKTSPRIKNGVFYKLKEDIRRLAKKSGTRIRFKCSGEPLKYPDPDSVSDQPNCIMLKYKRSSCADELRIFQYRGMSVAPFQSFVTKEFPHEHVVFASLLAVVYRLPSTVINSAFEWSDQRWCQAKKLYSTVFTDRVTFPQMIGEVNGPEFTYV